MARHDLHSFVNFAVQLDKLLQFFYYTGQSITIDFYSLMNFISVLLQNQHKGEKSQIIAHNYGKSSSLMKALYLHLKFWKAPSYCNYWTILLLLFFPLATSLLKTSCLLVWPFAVWKIKLSWAIARAFHLMRETWTCSSGWVGWRRSYWTQPFCVSLSSEAADINPEHWILLMKSSQQELCFSGISKPYQLGEALANNHTEQPVTFCCLGRHGEGWL